MKIQIAIDKLQQEGKAITYSDIGKICDMSKQRVHQVMKANSMTTGREHDRCYDFLAELKDTPTENLTVKQIATICGYSKSIVRLRSVLHAFNIPSKRAPTRASVREQLLSIDTEHYTLDELYSMTKYVHSKHSFRSFLRFNKIKFKKLRSTISDKLTSDEILL